MAGFDFFRSPRSGYSPRTPAAALRAIGTGTLPVEHFVYASASAKPIDEEPIDLEVIERALSRTDLTLRTSVLLKRVLGKLIGNKEQETALFGAEGINALESRSLGRIEKLKSGLAKEESRTAWRALAQEYFDLAELHAGTASVRAFYLREAYASLRQGIRTRRLSRPELALVVDILVALGLHGRAAQLLGRVRGSRPCVAGGASAPGGVSARPPDPLVLMLVARVAFHRGDYPLVANCCRMLAGGLAVLDPKERRIVSFWAERDG